MEGVKLSKELANIVDGSPQANRHARRRQSPAEQHVTTAGRRLSLIGERANVCSASFFGRTDGHLFAKKPSDRERGRRKDVSAAAAAAVARVEVQLQM